MKMNYNEQLVAEMDKIMDDIPQARASKMFGMPAYKVNGKLAVSAFDSTIVLKVGTQRAQEIVGKHGIQSFEPQPGRVWKDWVAVSETLEKHRALFEEAVRYVATGAG